MAGDWLRFEKDTLLKREIGILAAAHSIESDQVLGMVLRFWCWADSNSIDGNIPGMTCESLDALMFHKTPGFAASLVHVGWLCVRDPSGLHIPRFDRHMGESAKKRLADMERQRRKRERDDERDKNVTLSFSHSSLENPHKQEVPGQSRPPPADAGERPEFWLTTVWVFYFAGTQRSERDHEKLDRFFADLIASGWEPKALEEAIKDPTRPKRQTSWDFDSWLKDHPPKAKTDKAAIADSVRQQRAAWAKEEAEREAAWAARKAKQI